VSTLIGLFSFAEPALTSSFELTSDSGETSA
jgi:hypothetical protein